jgi:hypothetical protein
MCSLFVRASLASPFWWCIYLYGPRPNPSFALSIKVASSITVYFDEATLKGHY